METLGYVASLLMGITVGLMGGGGSILTVPILVYLFAISPIEATTTSLFIVGVTSLFTAIQYALRRQLDFEVAAIFSLPCVVGIYLARNILLPSLPEIILLPAGVEIEKGSFILIAFATLMIAASTSMIRQKLDSSLIPSTIHSPVIVGIHGIIVGFVTGFVGAGGGFLILPVLTNVLKLPMRIAIGTSLFIISVNSLFGFTVSALRSPTFLDWGLHLTILAIALVGSFVGAKLSGNVPERKLKRGFGFFVLIVGTAIIIERIFG